MKISMPDKKAFTQSSGSFTAELSGSNFQNFIADRVNLWLDSPSFPDDPPRWILNGRTNEVDNLWTSMFLTFNDGVPGGRYELGAADAKVKVGYTRFIRTSPGGGIMETHTAVEGVAAFEFDQVAGHIKGTLQNCIIQKDSDENVRFKLEGKFDVEGIEFRVS